MKPAEYVRLRNPVYVVRTNSYRAVVIGYIGQAIRWRKHITASTQLEARRKAVEYMERWNKIYGEKKDD